MNNQQLPKLPCPARPCVLLLAATMLLSGCTVLTYTGPNGERLCRRSFGISTTVSALALEAGTNGLRRLDLRGYQADSSQTVGTITEAAVRAAIQSAR